ncbi:MAG: EF-hand domain-containing protein [Candidatus Hydrogenedentes bacterium]|nr:EF-hand domain-containing protein [Candidatus Hydrogenedentota bacterium]
MRHALRITCCVSALIFLASAASFAGPETSGKKTILQLGDTDGDGMLSLAELRGVVPHATDTLFKRLDTDGDGRLSTNDWNWNTFQIRPKDNFPGLFRADVDNNQKLTFEETISLNKQMTPSGFIGLDADSDGTITRGEYSDRLRRSQGDSIRRVIDDFLRADVDGDGKASWEEIRTRAPEYPRPVFDWLDRNADNAISESDYRKPSRTR